MHGTPPSPSQSRSAPGHGRSELVRELEARGLGEVRGRPHPGTSGVVRTSSSGACRSSTSAGPRRSISAASAALSGSESGALPVEETFVRLAGTRSAGSMPAG